MSYAIRNDKQGWRAVGGPDDVGPDEYFSETPIEIVPAAPTRAEVEVARLRAYADPVTGSDRYFAEAASMDAAGEAGADDRRALGLVRRAEIQADHPWPET